MASQKGQNFTAEKHVNTLIYMVEKPLLAGGLRHYAAGAPPGAESCQRRARPAETRCAPETEAEKKDRVE